MKTKEKEKKAPVEKKPEVQGNGEKPAKAPAPYDPQKMISQGDIEMLYQKQQEQRCKTCWEEIQKSLIKYGCKIVPVMTVREKAVESFIEIVPRVE